jgi:hypothetical protein
MTQKIFMMFLYFFYYYNEALYKPFNSKGINYFNLLKRNNYKNNIYQLNKPYNKNLSLGRTKDQDGKSNIWPVEPKMQIIEEEITEVNKIILTSGLIISGCLFALPLLYTLNKYILNIYY